MENNILTIRDFESMVENATEIINENNLTDDNLADFMENKLTYIFIKNGHKIKLIKDLKGSDKYTPIDTNLVELIIYLNENGYYTDWCCEGSENDGNGYLAFTNNLNGVEITKDKIYEIINVIIDLVNEHPVFTLQYYGGSLIIRWRQNSKEEKIKNLDVLYKALMILK